jgi:phosphatidylglycerol:prolipoprotein diacylglycerol transferase
VTFKVDALEQPVGVSVRAAGIVSAYVLGFFGALPGLLWVFGGRLDLLLALPTTPGAAARALGLVLSVGGTAWMAGAMWLLWRAGGGLPISHLPPVRLTLGGPYTVMRHPIYAGYVAAFAGAGALAGSLGRGLIVPALLAWGSAIYALAFEEARLERRFGAPYVAYRERTPAFLPSRAPVRALVARLWMACRPLAERVANRVVLVRIGPTTWVTYGALAALAAGVIAVWLAAALAAAGAPPAVIARCLVGLAIAIPTGSRALWLAYHARDLRADPAGTLRQVGFVSWGGIIGLFAFLAGFARVEHLDVLRLLDAAAIAGLAGQAVARLGCFTYGCCYGRPSAFGIRWTDPEAKPVREHGAAGPIPRVPTQLLAAASAAALCAALALVLRRGVAPGTVTGLAFLSFGAVRFGIECLRADPRHGAWRLTQGQIGCLAAVGLGLGVLLALPAAPAARTDPGLDWAGVLPLAPVIGGCVAFVFGVYGFHWRRVGRW